MEYLVVEVWCKADKKLPKTRLNAELKSIYENKDYEWFKNSVDNIYALFKNKSLSQAEKDKFQKTFLNNNEIEKLCNGSNTPVYSKDFHPIIKDAIVNFFSELYTKFLGWKDVKNNYGTKKDYYDALVSKANKFKECPCCGYGDLKTWFSDSRSAFDHYLPIKHYPLSSVNFDNLAPICDECNGRSVKGEKDILSSGKKKAFYPFNKSHSPINILLDFNSSIIPYIIDEFGRLPKSISGHVISIPDGLETLKTLDVVKTITFLRNPIDRVISHYFAFRKKRLLEDELPKHVKYDYRHDMKNFFRNYEYIESKFVQIIFVSQTH